LNVIADQAGIVKYNQKATDLRARLDIRAID